MIVNFAEPSHMLESRHAYERVMIGAIHMRRLLLPKHKHHSLQQPIDVTKRSTPMPSREAEL
jgi:hypothetical protein